MKTLCLTLVLLLLGASCCDAMPKALQHSMAPVNCCIRFYNGRIQPSRIVDITKTHSSCEKQGFIVKTIRGKLICSSQTQWAKNFYNSFHNTEGSGLQP